MSRPFNTVCLLLCSDGLMDKVTDSDSVDAGSIPVRSTNKILGDDGMNYSTSDYAKLFLLMIIPVYGFFFTALLAFSKDMSGELRCLARGAFIARIVFLIFLGIIGSVIFSMVLQLVCSSSHHHSECSSIRWLIWSRLAWCQPLQCIVFMVICLSSAVCRRV